MQRLGPRLRIYHLKLISNGYNDIQTRRMTSILLRFFFSSDSSAPLLFQIFRLLLSKVTCTRECCSFNLNDRRFCTNSRSKEWLGTYNLILHPFAGSMPLMHIGLESWWEPWQPTRHSLHGFINLVHDV